MLPPSLPGQDEVKRLLIGLESNNLPTDMRKFNGRTTREKSNSVDAFLTYVYWNIVPGKGTIPF